MNRTTSTVAIMCPFCTKVYEVEVPTKGYMRWREGALIQKAMPTLSPSVRECLISGICAACQKKVFGE